MGVVLCHVTMVLCHCEFGLVSCDFGLVSCDYTCTDLLYRSDFFPGLGWMLKKNLWEELKPKWPSRLVAQQVCQLCSGVCKFII